MWRFSDLLLFLDIFGNATLINGYTPVVAVVRIAFAVLSRPYQFYSLYGIPGLILHLFGSRDTWRTQAHVLGTVRDEDSLNFKRSVQDECTMISVAAAIAAQIATTGFSLEHLSRTHWLTRAFFIYSVISSLIAVYYATTQQRIMGRLLEASQVRSWIRGTQQTPRSSIKRTRSFDWATSTTHRTKSRCDPQDYCALRKEQCEQRFKALEALEMDALAWCFTPSVVSVVTISAPQGLLSTSLFSLLLGIGVYFGCIWTRELDEDSPSRSSDGRNIIIVYLVSVTVCVVVYSVSRLIQNEDGTTEKRVLNDYLVGYLKKHPEVAREWEESLVRDVIEMREPESEIRRGGSDAIAEV